MNLQEGIFRRNNLEKKRHELFRQLQSYKNYPIKVGETPADNKEENVEVERLLRELENVDKQYLEYTEKINKANYENGILEKIAEAKLIRERIEQYQMYLPGEYDENIKLLEGVGVVKFGPIKKSEIKKELESLNKKAEKLSVEIDRLNQTTMI